jgi:hypothetical protein
MIALQLPLVAYGVYLIYKVLSLEDTRPVRQPTLNEFSS